MLGKMHGNDTGQYRTLLGRTTRHPKDGCGKQITLACIFGSNFMSGSKYMSGSENTSLAKCMEAWTTEGKRRTKKER